jgi:hypothetical protein
VYLIGPVATPSAEVFDGFDDEHGQTLLGSLQLEAEEEPVRRGASRANSVRFDVSAIQGSSWAQGSRSSGEFGPVRPSSGFGGHPMERTLSHKSDGRHSSTGHSIHSVHSAPSGRTSSLGLDTNFVIDGQDDDSPFDIPKPPPGLFILGTVPSIIRCWLNENFSHSALIYAVVCSGSQKSVLEYSLLMELSLSDRLQKDSNGKYYVTLPVYLPEAVITQPSSRANSPAPQLPALTVTFEVVGVSQRVSDRQKSIRVFLGSDALRAHSADILLSQNMMTLYGDDRNKLSVPFVRPEDETIFKNLRTTNTAPDKVELKGTARPFTPADQKIKLASGETKDSSTEMSKPAPQDVDLHVASSSSAFTTPQILDDINPDSKIGEHQDTVMAKSHFVSPGDGTNHNTDNASNGHASNGPTSRDPGRQESIGRIWGSWRSGGPAGSDTDVSRDGGTSSNYQRAGRGGRSMKVLKPSKVIQSGRSVSGARTGASYEPPLQNGTGERDYRCKSQAGLSDNASSPWELASVASDEKIHKEAKTVASVPRSSNPIGGASAFAWMNPGKSKPTVVE